MKVAIIHYWLVTMRGGEKVVEELLELFPDAEIFTHVVRPEAISENIRRRPIRTTFIAGLPGSQRHYQKYLPLMPMALEQLDLRGYDLVISSESGPAKGVITDPAEQAHALEAVKKIAQKAGFKVAAETASPIEGEKGNKEFLLYLTR